MRTTHGALLVGLLLLLTSCSVLPDEFNLSPIYRHRVGPDGRAQEIDILWPLLHWERNPNSGGDDTRLRPFWRQVHLPARNRIEHQFLAPLGDAYFDDEESKLSLFPLWFYRKHLEMGHEDAWDIDWNILYLFWGGQSSDGENYLGLAPIYGSIKDFLTYDEWGWVFFPFYVWWKKGDARGTQLLWPLISWGNDGKQGGHNWLRFLPFYGESIRPGVRESRSLLWPFFHWAHEFEKGGGVTSEFMFWPLFGWSLGPRYRLYSFLWPLFRYGYEVVQEGADPKYWQLDYPWPLLRYRWDDTSKRQILQNWFFPLFGHTKTTSKDLWSLLYPFVWVETWEDETSRHDQTLILPFFSDIESRRKKPASEQPTDGTVAYEKGSRRRLRLWPFFSKRQERDGSWQWQLLDIWPYEGKNSYGIKEAYDWIWVLAEERGDALGNSQVRSFANLYTSRNFAGRRFQCSVPFLFNYEETEDGAKTLRLFQVLPIRWGGED
ncbi:MAG: hypothetical protein CSA62_00395 [Planctomycetota bacterium]|nr:MAG: hypothetical protein CSA62_00395 [Planctomycetota bacterium]